MVDRTPAAPRLSRAQRLWLQELGLDRPLLGRLAGHEAGASSGGQAGIETKPAHTVVLGRHEQASAALQTLRQRNRTGEAADSQKAVAPQTIHAAEAPVKAPGTPAVANEATPDWASLQARIMACEACSLHVGRHRAVPGSGAIESVDWLVIGEAPGERDDRAGEPFQGKAGELLHAMLEAAGIDPQNAVFYTNVVKCRPRSNRPPSPEEIAACLPHLRSQIALLKPRGILALGRLAAQALLADGKPFEAQRGHVHAFAAQEGETIPVVVTYHPASLLTRPRHKAGSWRDLNLARTLL